jgi:heme/copper-type cytochrome/quinol oxidase subunit 4
VHGWLLSLASTGLAIAAHGVAGGGLPDAALTIPLTALIAWGGMAVSSRLRGLLPMIVALGVVQLGLHLLLTEMAADDHHRHAATGWPMLAAHAAATVLTAALLTGASTALAVVSEALAWLRRVLAAPRPVLAPVPEGIGVAQPVPARPGQLIEVVLRRVSARRGPPASS